MAKAARAVYNRLKKADLTMWGMLLIMFIGYVFIHDLFGGTLLKHNDWDSYTLQCLSWLEGRTDVSAIYSGWLELAEYNGLYFVSFPPVPSVLMLPFVLIFGQETPSNLIVAIFTMIATAAAYKTLTFTGTKSIPAAFLALFTVWGSNMMFMSTIGGVWFIAQGANLMLLLLAAAFAVRNKPYITYALTALSVGCRPFSALYFIIFAVYFASKRGKGIKAYLSQWKCLIAPAVIAVAMMVYNYMRFDNPLEFGHNYLPEFQREAQFGFQYVGRNLSNIFLRGVTVNPDLSLSYTWFDGFLFYLANPIFIVLFLRAIWDIIKKRFTLVKGVILVALALDLLFITMHRTMGTWQFGARYLVDLVAGALFYMAHEGWKPIKLEYLIGTFAIMFNVYGAIAIQFLY